MLHHYNAHCRLKDYAANVHKEMSCVCDIQRSTGMVTSNFKMIIFDRIKISNLINRPMPLLLIFESCSIFIIVEF